MTYKVVLLRPFLVWWYESNGSMDLGRTFMSRHCGVSCYNIKIYVNLYSHGIVSLLQDITVTVYPCYISCHCIIATGRHSNSVFVLCKLLS